MNDDKSRSGPVALSDQQLLDYLIQRASSTASEQLRAREDRRFRWFGVGTAVVGLVGAGILNLYVDRTIRAEVRDRLADARPQVVTTVTDAVDDRFGQRITNELTYFQFVVLAARLELGEAFTAADVASAKSLIREISQRQDLLERPELGTWLEKVVDAFSAAGQKDGIDFIVGTEALEPVLADTEGIGQTLAEHFGRRAIIGDEPSEEAVEAARARFFELAGRIDSQGRSGGVAFYRLLVANSLPDNEAPGAIRSEIERAANLDVDETGVLALLLADCHKNSAWGRSVTFETKRLAASCGKFKDSHLAELQKAVGP